MELASRAPRDGRLISRDRRPQLPGCRPDGYTASLIALQLRERAGPFTTAGFARMIERAAHMLRHACGYALANKGHDTPAKQGWLGHRSITSTVVYTAQAPNRFKDFWRD